MKKHFNIHVYRTDKEFSLLFEVDELSLPEDYEDDDIITLVVYLGQLDEEESEAIDFIEEISEEEYWQIKSITA